MSGNSLGYYKNLLRNYPQDYREWPLELFKYNFKVVHVPEKKLCVVDALSQ